MQILPLKVDILNKQTGPKSRKKLFYLFNTMFFYLLVVFVNLTNVITFKMYDLI